MNLLLEISLQPEYCLCDWNIKMLSDHRSEVVSFGSFHIINVALQFGPVAEAQQEGVLWIMQAQICFHTK